MIDDAIGMKKLQGNELDDVECKIVHGGDYLFSSAVLSKDGRYRYCLVRRWAELECFVMFVGLNPSTADAMEDDPTIRRCVGFAKSWGFSGLIMCNLFAWRATDPDLMMSADDPVGEHNDEFLRGYSAKAALTVAAWGTKGFHRGRETKVCDMLPNLHVLKLTKGGAPGHPLYLPKHLKPVPW